MPIRNQVAIVGTGLSKISRHADVTPGALVVEACQKALDDAGLNWSDIDGLACYQMMSQGSPDVWEDVKTDYIARTFDLRHARWFATLSKGSVAAVLASAISAVAVGACNYAVVWEGMYNPPGFRGYGRGRPKAAPGPQQFTAPYGAAVTLIDYVLPYSRYAALYGATREKMASFVVDNRKNAVLNTEAVFFGRPISKNDYLNDQLLTDLVSRLDCDMPVDGCGALVVARADRARDLRRSPAYVTGYATAGFNFNGPPLMTYEDFVFNAERMAKTLWANSGVGPKDIDCAALYDGFSHFVPMWLEAFGFCKTGEAFDYILDGQIRPDGEVPVNVLGGSLGCGRLHGMVQFIEAARQIQGLAGPLQTKGANIALANGGGPVISGGAAFVLSKDAS